jgi:hypothetical protein
MKSRRRDAAMFHRKLAMPKSIAELLNELEPDPWREKVGFSADLNEANRRLFDPNATNQQYEATLKDWISRHQPCIFRRSAAAGGFLRYCVLTEKELQGSDEAIENRIREARLEWNRAGFEGQASGFVILAISESLARAVPNEIVKQLAMRLAWLYLRKDIRPDEVFHDDICLEAPTHDRNIWHWLVGVNYFSAQGDRRWWQDHRLPGGMGFSMNSVGHMVKSAILGKAMKALEGALGAHTEDWSSPKVDSLAQAHVLAMMTIANASEGPSGKATELLSLTDGIPSGCPANLPPALANKDCCQYLGHYHTDYTIPSEYFRPDVERRADQPAHILDFTYLFNRSVANPDYIQMGEGRLIRDDEIAALSGVEMAPPGRIDKMVGRLVSVNDHPRLAEALEYRD